MKPLLGLAMIVKDESSRIRETVLSARPYIDHFLVLDTGSTDGTQEIIRRAMRGVRGAVCEQAFPAPFDFSAARNHALALVDEVSDDERPVFTLMLSGDELLSGGQKLREFLGRHQDGRCGDAACACARDGDDITALNVQIQMEGQSWPFPRVLRTRGPWRYYSRIGIHEQPVRDGRPYPADGVTIPGVIVRHDVSDAQRRCASLLDHHLPLLHEALARDEHDPMALYYAGNTYAFLADQLDAGGTADTFRMQAMSYFKRRSTMSVPDDPIDGEVVRHCLRRFAECALAAEVLTPQEALLRWDALCRRDPDYPEAWLGRLDVLSKCLPRSRMQEMVEASLQAADVARRAMSSGERRALPSVSPSECVWRCYFVAAQSAAYLSKQDPDARSPSGETYARLLDGFVEYGIEAGGPEQLFRAIPKGEMPFAPFPIERVSMETIQGALGDQAPIRQLALPIGPVSPSPGQRIKVGHKIQQNSGFAAKFIAVPDPAKSRVISAEVDGAPQQVPSSFERVEDKAGVHYRAELAWPEALKEIVLEVEGGEGEPGASFVALLLGDALSRPTQPVA